LWLVVGVCFVLALLEFARLCCLSPSTSPVLALVILEDKVQLLFAWAGLGHDSLYLSLLEQLGGKRVLPHPPFFPLGSTL
jgi:hypothetical protein